VSILADHSLPDGAVALTRKCQALQVRILQAHRRYDIEFVDVAPMLALVEKEVEKLLDECTALLNQARSLAATSGRTKDVAPPCTFSVHQLLHQRRERIRARFGDTPMFEVTLTTKQVERIETLLVVPWHKLEVDDEIDRQILGVQRLRVRLGSHPRYQRMAEGATDEWLFWSSLCKPNAI
jgi:hypothetical protein